MNVIKSYSEISHAEWILFCWAEVTTMTDKEPRYMRIRQRPMDEAMKLAGGSIKDLKPFLWVLEDPE